MYANNNYSQTGGNPMQPTGMNGAPGGIVPQQMYHPSPQMNQMPPTQVFTQSFESVHTSPFRTVEDLKY